MFLLSLESIALLLAMAIPGFIITKLKLIDNAKASQFISVMLLYVCQPFITFNSFLKTEYSKDILINLLVVFVFTIIIILLVALLGKLTTFKLLDKDSSGLFSYAVSFGNVGYMCIPFLQLLVPDNSEVILYASTSVVAFNLAAWTFGNYLLTGDKKHIKPKRALLNPASLSFILVLPLFLCKVTYESSVLGIFSNVFGLFADLVGPMAMTLLGMKFAQMGLKEVFLDPKAYAVSFFKLLLMPALAFALVLLIGLFVDTAAVKLNLLTLAAMPSANNILMFCELYGKDGKTAAKYVLISSLFSIVTIPLTLMLFF